ncbi:ligand-binding sensor domain-containing protein, partial [Acidiluteibacter ferrifornacis]
MNKKLVIIAMLLNVCSIAQNNVAFKWANVLQGTNSSSLSYSIAIDHLGNSILTGYFSGTIDFDPSTSVANLTSTTSYTGTPSSDIFIAKYDKNGNYIWAINMGGDRSDQANALSVDAFGNIYITGFYQISADFDPSSSSHVLTAQVGSGGTSAFYNAFLAKYDSNGNLVWVNNLGGDKYDNSHSIALDAIGNVYITGEFVGLANFDPSSSHSNIYDTGGGNAFLAKYDSNGQNKWAISLGGNYSDVGKVVSIDNAGYIYLTGYFHGIADFDPSGSNTNLISSIKLNGFPSQDIFLAKYDSNGNIIWAKSMGGIDDDESRDLVIDNQGNTYMTGHFKGIADFDPSSNTKNLTSLGYMDVFLSKYDNNGNLLWANSFGNPYSNDIASSIALDSSGNITIAGSFYGTVDFDFSNNSAIITSAGNNDAFISKYSPNGNYLEAFSLGGMGNEYIYSLVMDKSNNINIVGYFNGINSDFDPSKATAYYSSTGISAFVAKYSECSSSNSTDIQVACDTYTWAQNSMTYTATGLYNDTIQNAAGCDSVITLNLTINNATSSATNVTA